MTILVLGDANADLSAAIPRFPAEGDDSLITALGWGSGGCAANVAAALALLGAPARLLARVGADPAAEIALRAARAAGADLAAVQIDNALATGLCFAAVSPSGERTFFSYRGANVAFDTGPPDFAMLDGARWLHISGYSLLEGQQHAATLTLIDEAARRDLPISLDLCLPQLRARHAQTLELLPRLRILFANELELAALTNIELTAKSAEGMNRSDSLGDLGALAAGELLQRGVELVAVKLGPRGCMIAGGGACFNAPAFTVQAIDTNGCGDAFVAGFLFAHLHGQSPATCATLANAIGALKATRSGAAEALPDRASLRAFLLEHAGGALLVRLLEAV
jgi:ribokinase